MPGGSGHGLKKSHESGLAQAGACATGYGAAAVVGGKTGDAEADLRLRSTLFACLLSAIVLAEGYDVGILNGAVVQIKEDLKCSTFEISLIVTATPMFVMLGALWGGALADACGRYRALLLCCTMLVVGPLGMALAPSVALLLAARAFVGCGIGMGFIAVSMFIAEITPMRERGWLTVLEEIFLTLGMLLGYLVNFALLGIENDWRYMLGLGSILPALVLCTLMHPRFPESPRWLYMKGQEDEAEALMRVWLGDSEAEESIKTLRLQRLEAQGGTAPDFVSWSELLCSWGNPFVRRMLAAGLIVAVGQTASGYLPFAYYSSTVLKAPLGKEGAFLVTIAMGVTKLVVAVICMQMLDRVGRRALLSVSAAICSVGCALLAVTFASDSNPIFLALGFCLFMAGLSLGYGPVMLLYLAEVFVNKWRAKGMAAALFASRGVGALSTVLFPLSVEEFGAPAAFWGMAIINAGFLVAIWFFVVETHGHSLEEVEAMLKGKDPRSENDSM